MEILNSPPITLLPKNILKAPSHSPADQEATLAYQALPNPSPTHPLRNPDQRFLDSEVFTNKFAAHISGPMEKVSRRSMKRWSGSFSFSYPFSVYRGASPSVPQIWRKIIGIWGQPSTVSV